MNRILTIMRMFGVLNLIAVGAAKAQAATITAASCSQTDVMNAINQASASGGDIVIIAASARPCTLSSNITLTKPLTLDGGGNTSMTTNINMTPSAASSTRISGFLFDGNTSRITVGTQSSLVPATVKPFRIDHNQWGTASLSGPSGVDIEIWGRAGLTGLIDHNTIYAGSAGNGALSQYGPEPIHNFGGANRGYIWGDNSQDQTSWHSSLTPGSPNAIYIEDNTITENNSNVNGCSFLEAYSGAATVVRNNTISNCVFDEHGTGTAVGARWWELYRNTWYLTFGAFYTDIRAGSGVIFENHMAAGSTAGKGFQIREEDTSEVYPACYQIGRGYDPGTGESCKRDNPTVWGCSGASCPNPETASPAYIWGNDADMQSHVNITQGASLIQLNRDYYISATQPATLNRCESAADLAAGCPVVYAYAPFIHPYPLDANGMPNPSGGGTKSPCDVNADGKTDVSDVQLEVNMALGLVTCTNPSGQCTVTQVQRVVNAALGGACVVP